jgi:hypothetical protein
MEQGDRIKLLNKILCNLSNGKFYGEMRRDCKSGERWIEINPIFSDPISLENAGRMTGLVAYY